MDFDTKATHCVSQTHAAGPDASDFLDENYQYSTFAYSFMQRCRKKS